MTAAPSASAAGYSAPEYLPLRGSHVVGCTSNNGCAGGYHGYAAIDFKANRGEAIYPAGAGRVVIAVRGGVNCPDDTPPFNCASNQYTNYVVIDHGGSVFTRYLHFDTVDVNVGDMVDLGTRLGGAGDTGPSTPGFVHLHFERVHGSPTGTKVDPGQLKACYNNGTSTTYPAAWGYSTWNQVPQFGRTTNNDGCLAAAGVAPTGLSIAGDRFHYVRVNWAAVPGAARYYVYRNGVRVGESATPGYNDAAIQQAATYEYAVSSVTAGGQESPRSATIRTTTFQQSIGQVPVANVRGDAYCRRVGETSGSPTAWLRCTTFNGTSWTDSVSPGGQDWGYDIGWSWTTNNGNPSYCRRVGEINGSPNAHLRCTTFNGTSWTDSTSPGGQDWGYDTGWMWLSNNGKPSYCRRVGEVNGSPNAHLRCTTLVGTSWVDSTSPGGQDWGYDTGWSWTSNNGNPSYCRRVGETNGSPTAHLRCTTLTGTGWIDSTSPGGQDWGYDTGWSWVTNNGNPSYCRRVGETNGSPTAWLRCTTLNGTSWTDSVSPGGQDWGYDTGWSWTTNAGRPSYCRRVGEINGSATAWLRCTTFNGTSWNDSVSPGGQDWGYDIGWAWVTNNGKPTYCRRVGQGNGTATAFVRCTTFTGATWTDSTSPGGQDWGYDTGWAWHATSNTAGTVSNVTRPAITGIARVGVRLTTTTGTWTPSATGYTYQWYANGTAITGATSPTYAPTAAVLGKTITARIAASRTGYSTAAAMTSPTTAVAKGIITNTTRPTIAGTRKVGYTLTARVGTWTPGSLTYRYQWRANGVNITGATGSRLVLNRALRGKRISVVITASRTGYTSKKVASATTAAIQ